MSQTSFQFRGFPEFLEAAASRMGRPELAGAAGRIGAIATMATLCAQAIEVGDDRSALILTEAARLRDQLRIASRAADAMLRAVDRACGATAEDRTDESEDAPAAQGTTSGPQPRTAP